MSSVAADTLERKEWRQSSGSTLGSHGPCCDRARSWLLGMARSHDYACTDALAFAAPRWITEKWSWGPTRWPIAWCQAVKSEAVDCGVFAVFAREIFRAQGIEAYPGQVLRTYSEESTSHWRSKWHSLPGAFEWIGSRVVYHEVCVVRIGPREARIYDPTEGFWLEPSVHGKHGAHLAVRAEVPVALKWGAYSLVHGQWAEMARD